MKKLLIAFLFFANLFNYAQSQNSWKRVTAEDFKVTTEDTSVHAIIISENTTYYFDVWNEELRLFQTVERKIKVIDEKGLNYVNFSLHYYNKNHFEDVVEMSGIVYSKNKEKISKKSKLKNKYIKREENANGYITEVTDFQEVKPGDIVTYTYTIASLDMVNPPKWRFQHDIPTLYSHAEVNLPEFFIYKVGVKGNAYNYSKKESESNMTINYIYHYDDPIPGIGGHNGSFSGQAHFNFQTISYEYTMTNIPPFEKENYTDCMCNYQSRLELDLYRVEKNYHLTGGLENFVWTLLTHRLYLVTVNNNKTQSQMASQYLNAPSAFILYNADDWPSSDKWFLKEMEFYPMLLKTWNFKPHLDKALNEKPSKNSLENVIKIYDYVKSHFQWNKKYSMYPSKNLEKTGIDMKGNSADINFILISMLQKQGLEAYPVVLKIVSSGHIDEELASYRQFNHTIAAVEVEGKTLLLDAINPDIPWYLLPKEDLNGKGRIIKPESCNFIDLIPNKISLNHEIATIDYTPEVSTYNITRKLDGYFALDFKDKSTENVKNYYKKIENIYDFNLSTKDSANTLYNKIQFKIENKNNDTIYPLDVFLFKPEFLNTKRSVPIYFGYPHSRQYIVNVNIPEGYKFETDIKSFLIKYNGITATSKVYQDSSNFKIIIILKITKPMFSVDEYYNIRTVYTQIQDLKNTALIIKKEK